MPSPAPDSCCGVGSRGPCPGCAPAGAPGLCCGCGCAVAPCGPGRHTAACRDHRTACGRDHRTAWCPARGPGHLGSCTPKWHNRAGVWRNAGPPCHSQQRHNRNANDTIAAQRHEARPAAIAGAVLGAAPGCSTHKPHVPAAAVLPAAAAGAAAGDAAPAPPLGLHQLGVHLMQLLPRAAGRSGRA